jgi:hypothetical protein
LTAPLSVRLGDSTVSVDETRSDNTVFFDTWLRAQPPYWWIRPYLEGIAGLKQIYTQYSLDFPSGSGSTTTTTDQTATWTLGYGAGVDIMVAQADGGSKAVFVTLGIRRLDGGRASFTRGADAASANRVVTFDVPTDTTMVFLGISARVPVASNVAAPR